MCLNIRLTKGSHNHDGSREEGEEGARRGSKLKLQSPLLFSPSPLRCFVRTCKPIMGKNFIRNGIKDKMMGEAISHLLFLPGPFKARNGSFKEKIKQIHISTKTPFNMYSLFYHVLCIAVFYLCICTCVHMQLLVPLFPQSLKCERSFLLMMRLLMIQVIHILQVQHQLDKTICMLL